MWSKVYCYCRAAFRCLSASISGAQGMQFQKAQHTSLCVSLAEPLAVECSASWPLGVVCCLILFKQDVTSWPGSSQSVAVGSLFPVSHYLLFLGKIVVTDNTHCYLSWVRWDVAGPRSGLASPGSGPEGVFAREPPRPREVPLARSARPGTLRARRHSSESYA